jgi:hypothetical protein
VTYRHMCVAEILMLSDSTHTLPCLLIQRCQCPANVQQQASWLYSCLPSPHTPSQLPALPPHTLTSSAGKILARKSKMPMMPSISAMGTGKYLGGSPVSLAAAAAAAGGHKRTGPPGRYAARMQRQASRLVGNSCCSIPAGSHQQHCCCSS